MKKLILFPLAIFLGGCGGEQGGNGNNANASTETLELLDVDDPKVFAEVLAGSRDFVKLELRNVEDEEILYSREKDALFTGWTKVMFNSEQPMVLIQYKDGKEHGHYLTWHDNGKKERQSTHKEGKPHGRYTIWNRNGKKSLEGEYSDGVKTGDWNAFYEDGSKKFRQTFQDGNFTDAISWKPDGVKCPVTNFANGEGAWATYHQNGEKAEEGSYAYGKREGLWYRWHDNGQKSAEGNYLNGKQNGLWNEYDREGTPYNIKNFIDGERVDE